MINVDEIKKHIDTNKWNQIEYYKEIESTHKFAKELKIKNKTDRIIILTDTQTSGIGTKQKAWYCGIEKNIAMTIAIYPNCNIKKLKNITVEIAVKIKEAIKELYGYDLEIKKPNDLILNGKKICGILTETKINRENVKALYISFGFDVNENKFPKELEDIATSLKIEFNKEFSREDIIIKILKNLEEIIELCLDN